ncbi:protein-tyrosine phosphatase [Plectosphaerella plurivora]|uniref:Protein-tyrosine phosphatase n=1 Tax=Plectosphaerella plurivora TaxID=936078 RepID=A0A9P8VD03_9PEZI|nr:protein-tyrosine phosphatase [Plectosphaerella plurivora]
MELSKFRRKPKTPAIATDTKSLTPDAEPTSATQSPTTTTTKPAGQKQGLRKGAFRGLHLRSAVKRARSPATPAAPALSSSPMNSASNNASPDHLSAPVPMSPVSMRHRDGQVVDETDGSTVKVPAFLNQSIDALENKFMDLQWTERTRQSQSAREVDGSPNRANPYSLYKQTDMTRGSMDRYSNIKPYDRTRVRLQVPESTLDYVNASTIVVPTSDEKELPPLRYIAMQGPIQNSVDFVWRMVAEQFERSAVIVQLTTMVENNAAKCFPYLPMSMDEAPIVLNESDGWGDGWGGELRLDSVEFLEDGAIELRKLILGIEPPAPINQVAVGEDGIMEVSQPADETSEQEPREIIVWHFLYTRWPDFGPPAPEDLHSFLSLMRLSREYCLLDQEGTADSKDVTAASMVVPKETHHKDLPPRIIHCSAGVGRTGTFITLEHLMRELDVGHLEDDDSRNSPSPSTRHAQASGQTEMRDPILETIETLREQRPTMVQSPTQFTFLYLTLRKMWLDRYSSNSEDGDEPAAKRLEIGDPFVD